MLRIMLSCVVAGTGKSVVKALEVLGQHNVDEAKVVILTLFSTPEGECELKLTTKATYLLNIESYLLNICYFNLILDIA